MTTSNTTTTSLSSARGHPRPPDPPAGSPSCIPSVTDLAAVRGEFCREPAGADAGDRVGVAVCVHGGSGYGDRAPTAGPAGALPYAAGGDPRTPAGCACPDADGGRRQRGRTEPVRPCDLGRNDG